MHSNFRAKYSWTFFLHWVALWAKANTLVVCSSDKQQAVNNNRTPLLLLVHCHTDAGSLQLLLYTTLGWTVVSSKPENHPFCLITVSKKYINPFRWRQNMFFFNVTRELMSSKLRNHRFVVSRIHWEKPAAAAAVTARAADPRPTQWASKNMTQIRFEPLCLIFSLAAASRQSGTQLTDSLARLWGTSPWCKMGGGKKSIYVRTAMPLAWRIIEGSAGLLSSLNMC